MIQHVEAVYENGVFRPLNPVSLLEAERVTLTIMHAKPGDTLRDMDLLERVRAEVAAMENIPSLEEVRRALSKMPDSLSPKTSPPSERSVRLALYFFDSSAVAKRYHPEIGSEKVMTIYAELQKEIRISQLNFVEV